MKIYSLLINLISNKNLFVISKPIFLFYSLLEIDKISSALLYNYQDIKQYK